MVIRNLERNDTLFLRGDANDKTYFTEEGYLIDHPIVTRVGIFEYHNADGSIRREFRPPEEVFDEKSLNSFVGKPVILTHDAGRIDIDNVADEEIGTILEAGYRDGDFVKAHIVIHDVKALDDSGLRELSLGYNLDLDETKGEWEGQPYDAIQRNIRINHLALVRDARAGQKARLNIDSKDTETISSEGGCSMRRNDSEPMNPEDLQKQIEDFVAENGKAETPSEEPKSEEPKEDAVDPEASAVPVVDNTTEAKAEDAEEPTVEPVAPVEPEEPETVEEDAQEKTPLDLIDAIRTKHDGRKDADEKLDDPESVKNALADRDKDIQTLLDAYDALNAEKDMQAVAPVLSEGEPKWEGENLKQQTPEELEKNTDNEDACNEDCGAKVDGDDTMNTDSVDARVQEKVDALRAADKLNMDGLEKLSVLEIKKAIVKQVNPTINFDGKSKSYVDAAYDIVLNNVISMKKDVDYQRAQMRGLGMNLDEKDNPKNIRTAAEARREMIEAMDNKGGNN